MPLRAPSQRENLTPAPPETAEAALDEKSQSNTTAPNAVQQPGSVDRYTPAEKKLIEELKARDREVRAHEAAHKSAAGSLARGGPSYSYQRGPDGVSYAIGGEVQIDLSPVPGNPEATLRKAQQIRAAALAPAQPSAQDYAVAAQAAQMAVEAQRQTRTSEPSDESNDDSTSIGSADTPEQSQVREAPTGNPDTRITAYQRARSESLLPGRLFAEMA